MPVLDVDLNTARKLFDVNVFGVIATIQAFSSLLIAAQGTIVIIGSVGGVLPYPFGGTSFSSCSVNWKGFMAHPKQQLCTWVMSSGSKCTRLTSKWSTFVQEVSKAKSRKTPRRTITRLSLEIQFTCRSKKKSKRLKSTALTNSLIRKCMRSTLWRR